MTNDIEKKYNEAPFLNDDYSIPTEEEIIIAQKEKEKADRELATKLNIIYDKMPWNKLTDEQYNEILRTEHGTITTLTESRLIQRNKNIKCSTENF